MGYAQDLVNRGYYGYQGWGDAEAQADFSATGGAGKGEPTSGGGGGTPGGGNVLETAKQLLGFQREASQPAVASLQASIPELEQRFSTQRTGLEAEREPLKARYDRILKDMTARVSTDISREYGRRGIPLSSGMFETNLTERLNPLTERIGLEREGGLRDLTNLIAQLTGQETEQRRAIQNAIAQLQAGDPSGAISQGLNLLQTQQSAQAQSAQQALAQRQADLAQQIFQQTTLPESQANLQNIASLIAQRRSSGAGTDVASGLESLWQQFGG